MSHLLSYLPDLALTRLDAQGDAGLCITSLPWPRAQAPDLSLGDRPTFVMPLGQWPDEPARAPRRLLLIADAGGGAPDKLCPTTGVVAPGQAPPTAVMEEFARSPDPTFMWQRHLLRVRWGGRSIGLALGLRHAGEVHWWEACGLVAHAETPTCLVLEMGGTIPRELCDAAFLARYPGYDNPHLHVHNWLNGKLYMRLHANGVCEVYAHFINSKFVDDGRDLEDVVPVVGFQSGATAQELEPLCGPWDGGTAEISLDGVRIDTSEAARLATPEQPGRIDVDGDFLVWQAYEGVDLFGGVCLVATTGDAYIHHGADRIFPRGMARTLRFSFSLGQRSPRIARYLAPAWWYGVCEEFVPAPLLPVSNDYDKPIAAARGWVREHIVRGGFEDGAVPRLIAPANPGRQEPGWEGEMPYAQFLAAWRSGDADDYNCALRSAYHFTDVVVDHAAKLARMHGFGGGKFAVSMNRMQGAIAAYLETGDPYLIETARAVVETAYWTNRNSWPRLAVGRDAFLARSAVLLYRYFADEHFLRYARETAAMVVATQRPNGSFGDQGGGAGMHSWNGYITKPWMGLMALGGVLDYLELFPDEAALAESVHRFADWLMAERRHDAGDTWAYQHDYNGQRTYRDFYSGKSWELPTPAQWHHETLARALFFCAERFDDPAYFQAWARSHALYNQDPKEIDHSAAARLQFLPWLQAKLWNARVTENGVRAQPRHFGPGTPEGAEILAPKGALKVSWIGPDELCAPPGLAWDLQTDTTAPESALNKGF